MKRIRYFDVLRVVAFLIIIVYHTLCVAAGAGIIGAEVPDLSHRLNNVSAVTTAVTVFFMISGAGLMRSSEENFSVRTFYKKRLLRLYIPFWVAAVLGFIALSIIRGKTFLAPEGVSLWKWILTVLGVDGTLSIYGVSTMYFGIGEWFLGELIVFYLLFPILRQCVKKIPIPFLIFMTGIWLVSIYLVKTQVQQHSRVLVKLYEFVLGMYLGQYGLKHPKRTLFVSIPVMLVLLLVPIRFLNSEAVFNTLFTLSVVLSVSFLEPLFQKCPWKFTTVLCKYSYEAFLVHHAILSFIFLVATPIIAGKPVLTVLTFMAIPVAIVAGSVVVHFLAEKVKQLLAPKKGGNKDGK